MKYNFILLIILLILIYFNFKYEYFTPFENNSKYIPISKKYCLVTKLLSSKGGYYKSKIQTGLLPKLLDNQKAILINKDFTENICKNKQFGSGRQRGGFVCMDFLTKKKANKYNLEYSNKTCYDNLDFIPKIKEYKINK